MSRNTRYDLCLNMVLSGFPLRQAREYIDELTDAQVLELWQKGTIPNQKVYFKWEESRRARREAVEENRRLNNMHKQDRE